MSTDKYTYLGIDFHKDCTFTHAINTLHNKGLKALYKLHSYTENNMNIKTLLHVFDHTIKPVLLYGSEVWGINLVKKKSLKNITQVIKDIENNRINQLELKFYKRILQVKRNTATIGVRGELGRHPIGLYALANSLKYMHTIQQKPNTKLVKQA